MSGLCGRGKIHLPIQPHSKAVLGCGMVAAIRFRPPRGDLVTIERAETPAMGLSNPLGGLPYATPHYAAIQY